MTPNPLSERYRIYRVGTDNEPMILATCETPLDLGYALVLLAGEGEFEGKRIGVMDRPDPDKPGTWITNPFEKGQ